MTLTELFFLLVTISLLYIGSDVRFILFCCTLYLAAAIKGKRK